MKFKDMPYERPDIEAAKQKLAEQTRRLKNAASYEEAKAIFMECEEDSKHFQTMATLCSVRNSIDTRDEFYDAEQKFMDNAYPELQEYQQAWTMAMLESPYRTDFAAEYGDLMFVNAEIALKTFDPAIIPDLQKEAELTTAYQKLIASAQIPFEDGVYTLPQLGKFTTEPDDERRLAA